MRFCVCGINWGTAVQTKTGAEVVLFFGRFFYIKITHFGYVAGWAGVPITVPDLGHRHWEVGIGEPPPFFWRSPSENK